MSEYKPITSKIRERMEQAERIIPIVDGAQNTQVRINLAWLTERLDEIDSIHANLERENEGMKAELDRAHGEWDFWESTHVELPKDADGEYIHVGGRLDGYGKTIEVVELRHGRSGWVLISRDGNAYADTFAFTHNHAPTVEDVLVEMLEKAVGYSDAHTTVAFNAIAEYAQRLTLAGDAE